MSTRATYTIEAKSYNTTSRKHFYIHYDGYPEGAAVYFKNLVEYENQRGGNICKFLRANDLAEFTDKPENHGDTEYHYELGADEHLTAYKLTRDWNDNSGKQDKKECFYTGSLAGFLNKYIEGEENHFGKTKPEFLMFKGRTINKQTLRKKYEAELAQNLHWLACGHIGNVSLRDLLPMFYTLNGIKELPKEIIFLAEQCRIAYDHQGTTLAYIERIYSDLYQTPVMVN